MCRYDCARRAVWDFLQRWLIFARSTYSKNRTCHYNVYYLGYLLFYAVNWTLTGGLYLWARFSFPHLSTQRQTKPQLKLECVSINVFAAVLPSHLPWFYNWEWKLPKVIFQKAITCHCCHCLCLLAGFCRPQPPACSLCGGGWCEPHEAHFLTS